MVSVPTPPSGPWKPGLGTGEVRGVGVSLGTETTESTEIAGQRLAWGYTGTETVETEGNVSLKIPPFQGGGNT